MLLPARRHGLSRLEAFSDAVVALALTPLVVSLEVRTLEAALAGPRRVAPSA